MSVSDERLRESLRRWQEARAAGAEAAYLSERLRAGQVALARLRVLAFCGYPAAIEVVGHPTDPNQSDWLRVWDSLDQDELVRVLLILVVCVVRSLRCLYPTSVLAMILLSRRWLAHHSEYRVIYARREANDCQMQADVWRAERAGMAGLFELTALIGRTIESAECGRSAIHGFIARHAHLYPFLEYPGHMGPGDCASLASCLLGYSDPLNISTDEP